MPDTPQDGAAILKRIKPRLNEDWIEICLRPDLVAEFEEADSALGESKVRDSQRPATLGSQAASKETQVLEKKLKKIRGEIAQSAVRFVFRAKTRDAFRALCDEHPPRPGDQYDSFVGYDREAVSDALVRGCLVDPVFDEGSWAQLLEVVGAGQWQKLRATVEKVNGSVVQEPPKSLWASRNPAPPDSDSPLQPASA